jgi:hypothetical protein
MGRHVNFYAIDDDRRQLMDQVHDLGLVGLPSVVLTDQYDLGLVKPFSVRQADEPVYLIPQTIPVVEAFYRPFRRDPARAYLMPWVSPVIKLMPARLEGDALRHGRLFIDAPRGDPWSAEVYGAYEALLRLVRHWPRIEWATHVGPETLALARGGSIRLMVFGRELPLPGE